MENDIEELIDWLQKAKDRMERAGSASASATVVQDQLRDQTIMNNDIVSQKTRVRDLTATAKKLLKAFDQHGGSDEMVNLQDKLEVPYFFTF